MVQKSLNEQFPLGPNTPLLPWLRGMTAVVEARLSGVEEDQQTIDTAVEDLKDLGLGRINEVLGPLLEAALDKLTNLARLFETTSDATITMALGPIDIPFKQEDRYLFTPLNSLNIRSLTDESKVMQSNLISIDRDNAIVRVDVTALLGSGTYTGWSISTGVPPDPVHAVRTDNPHLTTAAQVGAYTVDQTNTQINTAIAGLAGSAPAALDTIQELATALGSDPNFATTMTNQLAVRLRFDAPQFLTDPQKAQAATNLGLGTITTDKVNRVGDTMTGPLIMAGGIDSATPAPQLRFGSYSDTAGIPSLSHIDLWGGSYGFGISAGTLNYFASNRHVFRDAIAPSIDRVCFNINDTANPASGVDSFAIQIGINYGGGLGFVNSNGENWGWWSQANDFRLGYGTNFGALATVLSVTNVGDLSVRDIYANRGNGQGVIYLGSGSRYLHWDGANYYLGGAGTIWHSGNLNPLPLSSAAAATVGQMTVQSANPTIYMADTDWGNMHIHHNGGYIGFLNNGFQWLLRCQQDGYTVINGTLRLERDDPALEMYDTSWGVRRIAHYNGLMGFLDSGNNWDFYTNNNGQIWTKNYGWMHDYVYNVAEQRAYAQVEAYAIRGLRLAYVGDWAPSPGGGYMDSPWWGGIVTGGVNDANGFTGGFRVRVLQAQVAGNWYTQGYL